MANYGAKILNNATGALAAQQAVIAAASNNIANVNTPGYTRRIVELQTRTSRGENSSLQIGNGVEVGGLTRLSDSFLERLVRTATSDKNNYGIQSELLQQVEGLFSLTGENPTIGSALTGFFASVDDLSANPSSIPLRAAMIDKANDLVSAIKTTYNTIAGVQDQANQRIGTEVNGINSLTAQIADLNGRIRANERAGSVDGDSRDQRDVVLQKLAEKIDFQMIELPDGSVNVALANGFVLVNGNNSRDLQVTTSPSFATGGVPPLLNGNLPNYIVYDYGSGGTPAHIDLTQVLKGGSGTVGGLLQLRGYAAPNSSSATPKPFEADGILTEMGARVEAITQQLLTTFNSAYLGDDLDSGTVGHQPSSVGLDGTIPSVYGFFDFEYSGAKNPTGGGLPDEDINNHAGVSNYSSRLQLTVTDPRSIAAAINTGTIGTPVFASGDGQILEALSAIQNDSTLDFNVGSVSFTGTFGGAYAEAVGFVGNTKQGADIQRDVSADNLITAQNSRDEVSGVSLDEEFANLIKFQKAYQASAKMIKIADTLLDQIVNLI